MSIAEDALLNGDICMGCGEWIGGGEGIPRLCPECDPDGDYLSYQEELLYRREEEGPFSPGDAVEVEWDELAGDMLPF